MQELIDSLKQLLIQFAPHIQNVGSVEEAHHAFLHMEESDEYFHKYSTGIINI